MNNMFSGSVWIFWEFGLSDPLKKTQILLSLLYFKLLLSFCNGPLNHSDVVTKTRADESLHLILVYEL